MDRSFWHKQTSDRPLFPDLLWSRPENKLQAGKLLIIGGNAHGFSAPAEAFAAAQKSGVGTARVLLPDSLQKTVGRNFPAGEYAPSTPSGSFSQRALAEFLEMVQWADAALLTGDFGHNSETAILLEKLVQDYQGKLVLVQDAIDYFTPVPESILNRPNTLIVTEFTQLQKIAVSAHSSQAFTSGMDLLRLVDNLNNFTNQYSTAAIVHHLDNTIVATGGQVSTTKAKSASPISTAARAAVWWLQNPSKSFEALSSAIIEVGR